LPLAELPEPIARALRDVIAPLVEGDGGVLYVVARDAGLHLHLAGACGGCPGARTTAVEVIEPALRAAGARGAIEVTSGWIVPDGAERISASEAPSADRERDPALRRSR
jgi:Fe-S cluster biogenesis protein NfuA